jgi:hypothetical protein
MIYFSQNFTTSDKRGLVGPRVFWVQNSFKMQKIKRKYSVTIHFVIEFFKKNSRIFFRENISPHLDSAFNLSVVF